MKNFQQNAEVKGWIRLNRSEDVIQLIRSNPLAFTLLTIIAMRARWSDGFSRHGLEHGEALIGDFENYGMTHQEYRTAKGQLAKWQFATFEATNAGTIAKLIDTRVFSLKPALANKQNNNRATNAQQTPNKRPTANQPSNTILYNEKVGNNQNNPVSQSPSSLAVPCSVRVGSVASSEKRFKPPTLGEIWAELRLHCAQGESFAEQYLRVMEQQDWKDQNGEPIKHWKSHVVKYATAAFMGQAKKFEQEKRKPSEASGRHPRY